uniref:Uncharacterized protein n=1 Tax=Panagrolaimus sp. PS1159 TaxID=55785 RepID=A0AC35FLH6_9BILA
MQIHSTYLRKVVYKFEEKVTAAGYLAASEMLLLGVEKPTNYSFICKFAMKDIELKFQHTWTNCQYISYTKCKMNTSLNKYHIKGCFQLGWKNDILEKSKFPMCRKFGLQTKEIESSCEAALSSTTVGRYGWLENINPYFGEYLKLDINSSIHGIYPQSNNKDIFILQTDIIIKAVFKNILLQSIKSLTKYELFLENNKMVTPIESYDGILYVDLIKKNSIYFKSIRCYEKDCHEVLFNEKLYFSFSSCTQRYRKFRNSCHSSEETICVPIWVKARNLITMNDKQNQHIIGIVYNYTDEYYRLQ